MKKIYEKYYRLLIFTISLSPCLHAQNSDNAQLKIISKEPQADAVFDNKFVTTPLHQLIVQQFDDGTEKLSRITKLLNQGVDVNAQNEDHRTPLWLVTFYSGDVDLIKLLIEHGADVTIPDVFNVMPLHNLVNRNDTQAAEILLDAAAQSHSIEKMMTFKNDAQETPLEITKTPEMDETLLTGELLHELSLLKN